MNILETVKYPHLERTYLLKPNPNILLGHEVFFTVKEDGSNLGCALNSETGEVDYRTRNMDKASGAFYGYMNSCDEHDALVELLQSASNWGDQYVVFGELMTKGKSPTRVETHEKTHFKAFDIWSVKQGGFMNYVHAHQECHHAGLPFVELLGTCNVTTMEEFWAFKDMILDTCKALGKEGSVVKAWSPDYDGGSLYVKEKLDTPRLEKLPRAFSEGQVELPELPESEIWGAVEKARADLGEQFTDIKIAMPVVAAYVTVEAKAHNCRVSKEKSIFQYYQERVREVVA